MEHAASTAHIRLLRDAIVGRDDRACIPGSRALDWETAIVQPSSSLRGRALVTSATVRFAEHGELTRDLRGRADAYLDGRARDLPEMYAKSAIIIAWFIGSWALLVFVASTWWQALALAVSVGLSIAAIGMSVQHDANHGATSTRAWVNRAFGATLDVMGVSSFIWRQKHNVVHHTFTNIEAVDYDLDFGVLARLTPEQRRRSWHRWQHVYLWALYGFLLPKWVFYDDFVILRSRLIGREGGRSG